MLKNNCKKQLDKYMIHISILRIDGRKGAL